MKKAQADIISALLIIVIALTLFSLGYTYLKPILEKRQDTVVVERVKSSFDQLVPTSLPSKIESVAKLGGEDIFVLDVAGSWLLNLTENSIEFKFFSKVTNLAEGVGWISLTPGASCPPGKGAIGVDRSSVVCGKAEKIGDIYQIFYKVWYRTLEDPITRRQYKITLLKHPAGTIASTTKSLTISRGEIKEGIVDGITLISTEIKILLV